MNVNSAAIIPRLLNRIANLTLELEVHAASEDQLKTEVEELRKQVEALEADAIAHHHNQVELLQRIEEGNGSNGVDRSGSLEDSQGIQAADGQGTRPGSLRYQGDPERT